METLTCEQCNKKWKRQPARGRKPRLCPTCLSAPQEAVMPPQAPKNQRASKPIESTVDQYKFPGPTRWVCNSCGASIKTEVSLQYEPTHACHKRLKRVFALELIRI
jgi:hypothetical protein